jgi:hypothetical protein
MSSRPSTRLLLCLAALVGAVSAHAEPLRGIPADVHAAMHVSYDEAAKSQLHPLAVALQKRMEKLGEQLDPVAAKRNKELLSRLGLKTDGTHTLNLGIRITKGEGEEGPDYAFYGVFQLDLRKSTFDSFAKEQGVSPVVIGDLTGWEAIKLVSTLLKVLQQDGGAQELAMNGLEGYAVVMPEDNVVIVSPVRELSTAIACWRNKKPSFELPASARAEVIATPLPHTQIYANVRKIQEAVDPESLKTDKLGLKDVTLVVGEDAKDFLVRAKVSFSDEAKAKSAAQEITSALTIGNLATVEADEDDADTKYYKSEAADFLAGIKTTQDGSTVSIRSAYALGRAKVLFGKLGEKVEEMAREAAKEKTNPAPANVEDEEMDAPAKTPAPKKTK